MTPLLTLLQPYKWVAYLALISSLVGGYYAWESHQRDIGKDLATAHDNVLLTKQKEVAAAVLTLEKAKVELAEKSLRDFKDNQEIQDAKNKAVVVDLSTQLHRARRVYDPNATAGCRQGSGSPQGRDPASSGNSRDDTGQTGGLLSEELSGLLVERLKEADEINIAYTSCRADAYSVREALRLGKGAQPIQNLSP